MSDVPADASGTGPEHATTPIAAPEAAPSGAPSDTPEPAKAKKARRQTPKVILKTKRHGRIGRHWTWGHFNTFLATRKWTAEGKMRRPTSRQSIGGCIYYAMKRMKKGTDKRIHAEALKDGLKRLTKRNTYLVVQDELRRLARWKVINRRKHPVAERMRRR